MNGICSRQKGDRMHIKRLTREPQGTEPLGRARHRWEGNI
jgi:hypothetical protein